MRPSGFGDPVAQRCGAFLVRLDRETETGPAVGEQRIVGEQRLEQV
jgi:hypothetical protein